VHPITTGSWPREAHVSGRRQRDAESLCVKSYSPVPASCEVLQRLYRVLKNTYAAKAIPGPLLMLDVTDKIGFKTVTDSIEPPQLDILVHSPGG
jgi:hypothetical protein